jgi:hypothetical protein
VGVLTQLLHGHARARLLAPSLARQLGTHELALPLSLCRHRTTFSYAVLPDAVLPDLPAALPDVAVADVACVA